MAEQTRERRSFADTLERIEELERTIEARLEPDNGWKWHRKPSERMRETQGSSHVLTLGWPPTTQDGAWTPCLAVYVAHGGSEGEQRDERRAVAFDREGRRVVLDHCLTGHAEHEASGGWVAAKLFRLPPDTMARADVAFVGIEARDAPADE